MKVKIGNYINYFGPYQLASLLCFWTSKVKDEYGTWNEPEWVDRIGDWLATDKNGKESLLYKFLNWINDKRKRTIKVRVDKYDTWSMDHTLAYIILPMLKQLKESKHASPLVDDADVPEAIRSTSAKPKDNEWDIDEFHHDRWSYVLGEMIWAFEQHIDDDAESQFYTEIDDTNDLETFTQRLGSFKIDGDGLKAWQERKNNGFRLFGVYYQGLWT